MESVVEQIYHGEYFPSEQIQPDSEEFQRLRSIRGSCIDTLRKTLTEQQLAMLEQAMEADSDVTTLTNKCIFAAGARFGIQLMLELFPMPAFDWMQKMESSE